MSNRLQLQCLQIQLQSFSLLRRAHRTRKHWVSCLFIYACAVPGTCKAHSCSIPLIGSVLHASIHMNESVALLALDNYIFAFCCLISYHWLNLYLVASTVRNYQEETQQVKPLERFMTLGLCILNPSQEVPPYFRLVLPYGNLVLRIVQRHFGHDYGSLSWSTLIQNCA